MTILQTLLAAKMGVAPISPAHSHGRKLDVRTRSGVIRQAWPGVALAALQPHVLERMVRHESEQARELAAACGVWR